MVSQAQKELGKFTSESSTQEQGTTPEPSAGTYQTEAGPSTPPHSEQPSTTTSENDADNVETNASRAAPTSASSLFSRLQSSLPPTLVSSVQTTVQNQLPHLKDVHARASSLSAALTAELQKKVQTGDLVARSEELFKEAGDFFRDAVRIIPPDEQEQQSVGIAWDGTDVWMLPGVGGSVGKGKEREQDSPGSRSGRPSGEGLRTGATRAAALLKQLRHDPEVITADPSKDPRVQEMYTNWVQTEIEAKDQGLEAKEWKAAIEEALADEVDGAALAATRDTLGTFILLP